MRARVASTLAVVGALALAGVACSGEPSNTTAGTTPSPTGGGPVCQSGVVLDEPLLAAAMNTTPQQAAYADGELPSQSRDCDGMRRYLSTPQPGWDLQSYVFYGYVTDSNGQPIAFSLMSQANAVQAGDGPRSVTQETGTVLNPGTGTLIGGVVAAHDAGGVPSLTSNPFSIRAESPVAGQAPQYVDARVIEGQLGQPGAVIELTAQVNAIAMATPDAPTQPLQFSVQVRDVGGVGQWGYGPSGFFPQWIHPNQRDAIVKDHGGSVADYLAASHDPMTDQGSFYYSSPVAEVLSFTISQGGKVLHAGTEGELLIDYVTQSFDARAKDVVLNGVQWTEFSTLLEGGTTLKVGEVTQSSVGTLPYVMALSTDGPRLPNGALDATRWDIDGLELKADPSANWTSPRTKLTYSTRYTAKLSGDDPSMVGELVYEAAFDDQEVTFGTRSVYEGIYKVHGTLGGKSVSGYAWAEIQPSGALS